MDIKNLIDEAFEREERDEPTRCYIGASSVGHSCTAMLSFSHRGYPDTAPDPRLKRIFRDGHRIEDVVIKDMMKAGVHVMERDPMTNRQWRYEIYHGNVMGNADGLVEDRGELHLLEIKSMNDNKFKELVKKGVRYSHPMYFAQMQFLMGLSDIRNKAVLVAYNKNTSEYHHEWVEFDIFQFKALVAKCEDIIKGNGTRISEDESDWRCRGCFKRDACWNQAEPEEKVMRTCGNALASIDKEGWHCEKGCVESCKEWVRYEPLPKA